jgi:hypothetical protein
MPDFVGGIDLNLSGIEHQGIRDNFQLLQDFLSSAQTGPQQLQVIELFVTGTQAGIRIGHKLGAIPLDVIVSRLVAPSAARLIPKYAEFTKDAVVFDTSGLDTSQTLSARLIIAAFSDVVTVGTVKRGDSETQEFRSKF